MKTIRVGPLALVALFGLIQAGWALELLTKESGQLNMHGRLQTFGFTNYVEDPFRDKLRLYLFVKQARLSFNGNINDIKYDIELAFGGEEGVKSPSGSVANTSQGLLDFNADVPLFGATYLKMGQFKVPYSLERLSESGSLMFAERSIDTLAFNAGRDVGLALWRNADRYAYTVGIFTGGGRDNPIRNIPLRLGSPMLSARVGIKQDFDDDLFDPKQVDINTLKPGWAAFANGFYLKDSRVGHSTVLKVKAVEHSILTNSNWNPFIDKKDVTGGSNFLTGDLWNAGADAVVRAAAGPGLLTVEAEGNYGQYKNAAGILEVAGARLQMGYYQKPWGVALRYAVLFPDDKFASGTTKIFASKLPVHEITPAITLFHRTYFKIVMDAPLLVNVPVASENKLGYYVLTEQPDQTGVGPIQTQVVPSGRLLLQFAF